PRERGLSGWRDRRSAVGYGMRVTARFPRVRWSAHPSTTAKSPKAIMTTDTKSMSPIGMACSFSTVRVHAYRVGSHRFDPDQSPSGGDATRKDIGAPSAPGPRRGDSNAYAHPDSGGRLGAIGQDHRIWGRSREGSRRASDGPHRLAAFAGCRGEHHP